MSHDMSSAPTPPPRLARQLAFILELEQLKQVLRRSRLIGTDRRENSAEHSWHVAMLALVLAEYSAEPIDIGRVLELLLVHDIVEIDAGDTPVYDTAARANQATREQRAADRLFALLPDDQAATCRGMWDEFEEQATAEARFAKAVDRLMPVLQNYHNRGVTWHELGATLEHVLSVNRGPISAAAPAIWVYVEALLEDANARGYMA
jgi:putative hydrolase of HD superfamily